MAVQNINNYRRGRGQNTVVKPITTQQRQSTLPSVNQVLRQTAQQYQRNLQSANPANLAGSLIYTSQYGDEALADAKRRAAKGDVISQLYVNTAENILKPVQETYQRDSKNANPVVAFTSGLVQTLPNLISTIPAGLQAINLIQQGQQDVVKKGYQSIPGIVTDTVSAASSSPLAFAGTVAGGAALGGVGAVSRVGGVGKAGKTAATKTVPDVSSAGVEKGAKIKTPEPVVKKAETPAATIRVTSSTPKTTPSTPATALKRQALSRGGSTIKTTASSPTTTLRRQSVRPAGNTGKVSGSGTLKTQQRTVIRGNVPREFSGNVGKGYSADVKINGNTFVLTPVDNRITLNTQAPSTIRPVSFDDVVQNLVKGQGIAIKTGDRMGTVTNLRGPAGPVGATLEPGGVRARFPDYQPNVYRAISSDDYFASAIGGTKGVDIYTYPFGNRQDYSPRQTPKTIKAINSDALFRLMDKTLNPAPMKLQDLSAYRNNPRVKEIELVEAGQTTKPRELPPNIQPLRITRIKEYVADYQKTSFIGQKAKSTAKPAAGVKETPDTAQGGRTLTFTRQKVDAPAKTGQKSSAVPEDTATPLTNSVSQAYAGFLATATALPNAKLSTIPATVVPIPGDSAYVDSLISSSDASTTVITGDADSAISGDMSMSGSVSGSFDISNSLPAARGRSADASITSRMRAGRQGQTPSRRRIVDTDNDDAPSIRRIRNRDADRIVNRNRRRRKDSESVDEEDEKKKKARKRVKRTYRQKVNPLPWLEDASDTSWLRKDLSFMRMPARVKVSAVRPALETYNDQVKAFNAARKKLRSTARETTAEGRKALSTLKRLYKTAVEARGRAETAVEKNRR